MEALNIAEVGIQVFPEFAQVSSPASQDGKPQRSWSTFAAHKLLQFAEPGRLAHESAKHPCIGRRRQARIMASASAIGSRAGGNMPA